METSLNLVERLREYARGLTNHELSDEAADEIERLQVYKRAQAEDIITLGQQVGKLEVEIEKLRALFDKWHTIAAEQKQEIERLRTTNDNLLVEIKLLRLANDRFENRAALEQKQ